MNGWEGKADRDAACPSPSQVTPQWLTPEQAGVYCGLPATAVKRAYRENKLIGAKSGHRTLRFSIHDLDEWMRSNCNTPERSVAGIGEETFGAFAPTRRRRRKAA